MKNAKVHKAQSDVESKAEDQHIVENQVVTPASETQTAAYLRSLKSYFVTGEKTEESLTLTVRPFQLAEYQRGGHSKTDYPFFYDSASDGLTSVYRTLEHLVEQYFDKEASAIIHKELSKRSVTVQKISQEEENGRTGQLLGEEIIRAFQALDFLKEDPAAFEEKIDNIRKELFNQAQLVFDFTAKTAFQILNLQHRQRAHLKSTFLKRLKRVITGLSELLMLHGDTSKQANVQMDFAADLISFDKLRDITVSTVSSQLPESRQKRLKSALQTLTTARESYVQRTMTIMTSEEVLQSFDLQRIFDSVSIEVASEDNVHQALVQSQKDLDEFVKTIAALRLGTLMIDQKYDEGLHDDYFDHFDLSYLTKDDLQYLPPIIVIEDARQLAQQSNDFLRLLSSNSFVKILGLNRLDDLFDIKKEVEPDYLELASLAIFRRNSYVFQGGIDRPSALNKAYKKGLAFPGAAFWNILIPSGKTEQDKGKYTMLHTAIESRYFPIMEYEADGAYFADNQISLKNNSSPDTYFVSYEQKIQSTSETAALSFGLTMADFLVMDTQLKEGLEIIPPEYQTANLIPLHEYLSQSVDLVSGKIPFIWLADDQNRLRRAAIPVYWIHKCRERLEYWSFLQSLAGINNTHLKESIEEAKQEWEKAKSAEIESLKSTLREQFEKERAGDLQKAVTRMLSGLLNQGKNIESVLTEISNQEFKPVTEIKEEPAPPVEEPLKKDEEEIAIIKEEVWVESEDCTSCKDCIDALPAVFKYNENKQAYVHNPKGGTFASIVKAAEKCPARCIHPGVPQNKSEKSLDEWMKRAERFN